MARRGSEASLDQSTILENVEYSLMVLQRLNDFRLEQCLTDTVLIAGYEEFPCHKNVLAVSSPYFRAMFSNDLLESKLDRIQINEVSPWTLRRVIDYAYTGKLEITVDNAQDMLAAGSLFQLQDIIDACCEFLSKHLHPSNCLGIEHFAHLHSCTKLEAEAHQHVLDNFSTVVDSDEFVEIPLERLLTYLASDLIDVRNEECAYSAAMRWIQHDLEHRQSHAHSVFAHIRLAIVDYQYLCDIVQVNPVIRNCEKCRELVQDAVQFHSSKIDNCGQRRRSMQTEAATPRPSTVAREVLVIVGGITENNQVTKSVDMYDPAKEKWSQLPDLQMDISWFSICALDNNLILSGGIKNNMILSVVLKFDSSKRSWTQGRSMLTARARHASAVVEGKVYVLGGISFEDGRMCTAESIECFCTEVNQWTKVGEFSFPRKQSRLVPFEQTLVEVGGSRGDFPEDTMETYLCNSNGTVVHSGEQFRLPEPIKFAQLLMLDKVFYILWEDSKKVIMLNPLKRTFRSLAPMNNTHIHGAATVIQNKIYVVGGLVNNKPSSVVECYNPDTDTWEIIKSVPQARACLGCVTLNMQ